MTKEYKEKSELVVNSILKSKRKIKKMNNVRIKLYLCIHLLLECMITLFYRSSLKNISSRQWIQAVNFCLQCKISGEKLEKKLNCSELQSFYKLQDRPIVYYKSSLIFEFDTLPCLENKTQTAWIQAVCQIW